MLALSSSKQIAEDRLPGIMECVSFPPLRLLHFTFLGLFSQLTVRSCPVMPVKGT